MRLPSLARIVVLSVIAFVTFIVLVPGCGRSSLEPETLGDGGSPPVTQQACGPQTCPNGCCDSSGTCRVGSDTRACGSIGGRCTDCVAQGFDFCDGRKVCGRTVSNCDANECPNGCCTKDAAGRSQCLAGIDSNACGRGGKACIDCSDEGRACDPSSRSCSVGRCDASNCAGCCVGDQCLSGADAKSCGSGGEKCDSCGAGQTCNKVPTGGGVCEGNNSCGPQNCSGCCLPNGICVVGSDSTACGKAGQTCSNCSAGGLTCVAVGQPNERSCQKPPACGPANCAGCCQGNNCVIATTPAACGQGGQACSACGANETCSSGSCQPAPGCSAANCAGCCVGDICAAGNQNTACGAAGAQCSNCTGLGGQVCQGGSCQAPACGPGNCAGCCAGNTCVVGTQDNACGPTNGAQCSDCTLGNEVCQGRQCVAKCGPGNCAGCCSGNTCAPGVARSACGSGGAACSNCSAAGSVCDAAATPRVCSGGNTCPETYAACGAAVKTAVTPSLQGLCAGVDLDALQSACATDAESATCVQAFAVLAVTNAQCATCMRPFDVNFTDLAGLYRCAAPFVSDACNRSSGCAIDCASQSCDACPTANEEQCKAQVNGGGGQCNTFVNQTVCVTTALGNGQLCSPLTYQRNFGDWLRAVGAHFCGSGP